MIYHEDIYTEEIISTFISLWSACQIDANIQHVFSGRVVYMLHSESQVHLDSKNIILNPLPDDKILDWSKLKKIADDIFKCI